MHGEYFSFFVLTSLTLNLIPTTVVFVVDIVVVVLVAVVVVLILELDTGPQLDSPLMQSMQVLFNNIQF